MKNTFVVLRMIIQQIAKYLASKRLYALNEFFDAQKVNDLVKSM